MKNQPNAPTAYEIIETFKAAMAEQGIVSDAPIIADGQIHRIHINGHKSGTLNGVYVLHLDGTPAGYFEDFTTGMKTNWKLEGYEQRPINPETQKQIDQAKTVRTRQRLPDPQRHTRPHGAKQGRDGALIAPLYKTLRMN